MWSKNVTTDHGFTGFTDVNAHGVKERADGARIAAQPERFMGLLKSWIPKSLISILGQCQMTWMIWDNWTPFLGKFGTLDAASIVKLTKVRFRDARRK